MQSAARRESSSAAHPCMPPHQPATSLHMPLMFEPNARLQGTHAQARAARLQGTHAQARAARLQGTRTQPSAARDSRSGKSSTPARDSHSGKCCALPYSLVLQGTCTQASAALCRTAKCCKGLTLSQKQHACKELALRQVLHFAVQPSAASDTHTAKSSTPARDSHSGKSRLQVHPKLSKQDTHSLPCATRAHALCCTALQEYEYMHPDANTPGAAGVCGVGSVAHLAELQPKQRCASACTSSHTHTGGMSALNVQCTKMGVLSAARPLGCLSRGITGEPGVQLPTATLIAGAQQVHGTRSTYQ